MNTNILIIEDNPADVALIEAYLKDAALKHALYKSDSLNKGLSVLRENDIDLVLLDLKLVDTEGFKTLQLFREKAPDIPVIVLTGFKNEIMGIQSVRAGAQDFLVKGDFDSRSLARTIRYSLQRFEAQAKLQEKAKELSKSERRNQLAHRIARFGKWEMDIVTYTMKWDDEIFRFFGFPPHSFDPTLSDYIKYVHVEDREKVNSFFEEAIKDGQPHSVEHRIVIDNTVVKYLQVKAKVDFDEQANRILVVGVVQDISEMKMGSGKGDTSMPPADAMPFPLEKSLASEFNFNLRTPLASLTSFLYLLERTPLTSQQQNYVDGFKTSLDDLSFALNNWLNMAIFREGQIEAKLGEVAVSDIIAPLKNAFTLRSQHSGRKLEFNFSKQLPAAVITDEEKFSQILYNLVETAIRNSVEGSRIEASLQAKNHNSDDCYLLFRITFENQAVSAEQINSILEEAAGIEEFSSIQSGMLPLVISAKMAQKLGGVIRAIPKSGPALSMSFEHPARLPAQVGIPIPESPQAPLQILLVEDHDLHRLATKRMLTSWSTLVSVDLAENGRQAVEKALAKKYDLVLLDLHMPVMNGIEAAIKIRAKSNIPIIALTANESKQEQERCAMVGINDYVVKPIRPEHLFSCIMQEVYPGKP
ncbi:MAG: response regulator [Phaeodactylibacter sp.]|nr:response regulator [Phaeodactylibacter sp.]